MNFRLELDKSREEEIVAVVHERSLLTDKIEELVMEHSGADSIVAYTEDEIKMLAYSDIECISVCDGKTYAVDRAGESYRLKQRLYEVETCLPAYFIRINKSAIANERRIERFTANFSGAVDVRFKSGHTEYVSRRCFAAIKRRYAEK